MNVEKAENVSTSEGQRGTYEFQLPMAVQLLERYKLDVPTRVQRLTGGMINDIFLIDEKYVLKVMSGNPELMGRMEKEAGLYHLLSAKGVPVPKVYGVDTSHDLIPYDYLLMERVRGLSLDGIWSPLSPRAQFSYLEKLGYWLAKINTITFPQFGEDFKNNTFVGPSDFSTYFEETVEKIVSLLRTSQVVEEGRVTRVENYLRSSALFKGDFFSSLLHGNFNHNNVLVDQGEIKGIVDWEFARAGHSEEDIAVYLYRGLHMEQNAVSAFRKGYESVLPLDNQFAERMYIYNLLYYLRTLPYVSSWVHRPDKQREYYEETERLFQLTVEEKK